MVHPTKTDSEVMTIKQKERDFISPHSVQSIISKLLETDSKLDEKNEEGREKTPNNNSFALIQRCKA